MIISHENIDLSIEVINLIRDLFDTENEDEISEEKISLYNAFVMSYHF